jgi:hypothetical protein
MTGDTARAESMLGRALRINPRDIQARKTLEEIGGGKEDKTSKK